MNNLTYHFDDQGHTLNTSRINDHSVPIALVSIFGFWIFTAGIMIYSEIGYAFLNLNLFPLTLFGGGLMATFYYQKERYTVDHFSNITIKTTNAFVNKWFISAFLFPVVITLLFWSYSIFADELYFLYAGEKITTFNAIQGWSIAYIKVYFLIQFIFLFGFFAFQKIPILMKFTRQILKRIMTLVICIIAFRILMIDYLKSFLLQQLTPVEKRKQIKPL